MVHSFVERSQYIQSATAPFLGILASVNHPSISTQQYSHSFAERTLNPGRPFDTGSTAAEEKDRVSFCIDAKQRSRDMDIYNNNTATTSTKARYCKRMAHCCRRNVKFNLISEGCVCCCWADSALRFSGAWHQEKKEVLLNSWR